MTPTQEEIHELTMLAAKAVHPNCEINWQVDECFLAVKCGNGGHEVLLFSPYTSREDTMMLMVELEMDVIWGKVNTVEVFAKITNSYCGIYDSTSESKRKALSLAVLRVAAEIGRRK